MHSARLLLGKQIYLYATKRFISTVVTINTDAPHSKSPFLWAEMSMDYIFQATIIKFLWSDEFTLRYIIRQTSLCRTSPCLHNFWPEQTARNFIKSSLCLPNNRLIVVTCNCRTSPCLHDCLFTLGYNTD